MKNLNKMVTLKALPGDNVRALSRLGIYEDGDVWQVETYWNNSGEYWNSYRVLLKRRGSNGSRIAVYCTDDKIA